MLGFAAIDFDEFHTRDLPARIAAGNGALAASDIADAPALALRVGASAYTYVPSAGSVAVRPGDDAAAAVVELDAATFSDYAHELQTCFGLVYGAGARMLRGTHDDWFRWEPAIRALYHGRPLYDPAWASGLDLHRAFTLEDADAEIAAFLAAAGFARVRGVFTPDEIADLVAEVERLEAAATPDDGRSWWTTVAGEARCCRLIYANARSARIAALAEDPRLARFRALAGEELVPELDCLDGIGVVIKQPGADSGLADLPWHQDCGLGGHPVLCPAIAVGIQLDPATAETGQLHFLAGSHRGSAHQLRARDLDHLPIVAIDTEPGDVTLHYGHVLHAAPAPTGRGTGRRAMYVTATRPETIEFVGPGRGYNDVLFTCDGQVHHVDELVATE
ncbi:MAG: phytanoyl-CoA dioxygenase family protein [Actinobacteria bacterium]|nr:phytanoyl-CoA dioxygenase family protein [Actinomycetota bacterium]